MKWCLRTTGDFLQTIRQDLIRPHPFAAERVGFVFARMGNERGAQRLLLPYTYSPIPDGDYEQDPCVGACIGSTAIRRAMQFALTERCGAFHIHMHDHIGTPSLSMVDVKGLPPLLRSFRSVQPDFAHGAILLSRDRCIPVAWLPDSTAVSVDGYATVLDRSMTFDEAAHLHV